MDRWTPLPGQTAPHLFLDRDPKGGVLVRVGRFDFEPEAPRMLVSDAALFRSVLLELIAHDVNDEDLGAFVRLTLEPLREAAVGKWRWTKRVSSVVTESAAP